MLCVSTAQLSYSIHQVSGQVLNESVVYFCLLKFYCFLILFLHQTHRFVILFLVIFFVQKIFFCYSQSLSASQTTNCLCLDHESPALSNALSTLFCCLKSTDYIKPSDLLKSVRCMVPRCVSFYSSTKKISLNRQQGWVVKKELNEFKESEIATDR